MDPEALECASSIVLRREFRLPPLKAQEAASQLVHWIYTRREWQHRLTWQGFKKILVREAARVDLMEDDLGLEYPPFED